MARVTVEDCLKNVGNRFELVMIASKRARQIATGGKEPLVKENGDKPTVLALREIEENLINADILIEAERAEQALREELQDTGPSMSMGVVRDVTDEVTDTVGATEPADAATLAAVEPAEAGAPEPTAADAVEPAQADASEPAEADASESTDVTAPDASEQSENEEQPPTPI